MLTAHNQMIRQNDNKPEISGACVTGASDNIQTELKEARFTSSFMTAVCSSLELDDICSIAARTLFEHAPYQRIVFEFSDKLEGRNITILPMARKEMPKKEESAQASCIDKTAEMQPTEPLMIVLHDNLGAITIYDITDQNDSFSGSLLINIAACFSQAIRNTLEHSRIKDLAMRDGLTGVFNRRVFDETLAHKVKCPDHRPVSLLLIDLDNFKQVNDTFGHEAGDQVLKAFASILKDSCRGQDLVARFGGEEFAIILEQTKTATAHAIAQRIRNRLEKHLFTFDQQQHRITVSIGLATCQETVSLFTSNLVKQADRALYQAKKSGKNRVCVYPADLLAKETQAQEEKAVCPLVPANC